MRTICWPIVAAALLGSTPGPAIAQGILSKARYAHPAIAALPPAVGSGQSLAAVAPVAAAAYSGDYPLARFLYLSVNQKPGAELDPLRREFLRYVLSAQGQADVKKDGYLPLTAAVAAQSLESVGIKAP